MYNLMVVWGVIGSILHSCRLNWRIWQHRSLWQKLVWSDARICSWLYQSGIALRQGDSLHSLNRLIEQIVHSQRAYGCSIYFSSDKVAKALLAGLGLSYRATPEDYATLWEQFSAPVENFLSLLNSDNRQIVEIKRFWLIAEQIILERMSTVNRPCSMGATYVAKVDITRPVATWTSAWSLPPSVQRLHCFVEMAGEALGIVELPVMNGQINGLVLAEAIASRFAWAILTHFFENNHHPNFQKMSQSRRWALFWQTLWQLPPQKIKTFSPTALRDSLASTVARCSARCPPAANMPQKRYDIRTVEVSDHLKALSVAAPAVKIVVTVGGLAIGSFIYPVCEREVSAKTLREAITFHCRSELVTAAVQVGIIGHKLTAEGSLRSRLSVLAAHNRSKPPEVRQTRSTRDWQYFKSPSIESLPAKASRLSQSKGDRLPILMYHSISSPPPLVGSQRSQRFQLHPESFSAQLRYLKEHDFYSVTLSDWREAILTQIPLPEKAVLMTFDDGYLDFYTHAWPLLKQYGFSATVFIITDWVGRQLEGAPLMDWQHIAQLQAAGIEVGSHSNSHASLLSLPPAEIMEEGLRSRQQLEQKLGTAVRAFCYPFGDSDSIVRHLIGACGYETGVSLGAKRSSLNENLLNLSRIEIKGTDSLQRFAAKLKR